MAGVTMDQLVALLSNPNGQDSDRIVALWLWLQERLHVLHSQPQPLSSLRGRWAEEFQKLQGPPRRNDAISALRSRSSPAVERAAAKLLVQYDIWYGPGTGRTDTIDTTVTDIGGGHALTTQRGGIACWFDALRNGGPPARSHAIEPAATWSKPPAADYPPSMECLAYALWVVPRRVCGVGLRFQRNPTNLLRQREMRIAQAAAMAEMDDTDAEGSDPREYSARPRTNLKVHLDTLGPGLVDGLVFDPVRPVFSYGEPVKHESFEKIETELREALERAADERADILVLPELAVPERLLPVVAEALANDQRRWPSWTVLGLRHVKDGAGSGPRSWANEAVVLGRNGTELLRQRKLTAFRFRTNAARREWLASQLASAYVPPRIEHEEDTIVGDELRLMSTAMGMISAPICLDLIAGTYERLVKSPASILLVPSLSPTARPHEAAAVLAARFLWGAVFVCNRPADPADDGPTTGGSFWTMAKVNRARRAKPLSSCGWTGTVDLNEEAIKMRTEQQ